MGMLPYLKKSVKPSTLPKKWGSQQYLSTTYIHSQHTGPTPLEIRNAYIIITHTHTQS